MKFQCPKCSTNFVVADVKLPSANVFRFTCKKCSHRMRLRRVDADAVELLGDVQGTESLSPDFSDDEVWYAMIGGTQQGPFTREHIGDLITRGETRADVFVWAAPMPEWQRANELEEFGPWTSGTGAVVASSRNEPELEMPSSEFSDAYDMQNEEDGEHAERAESTASFLASAFSKQSKRDGEANADSAAWEKSGNTPHEDDFGTGAGEQTRQFFQTAGLYKRRRMHRVAAIVGICVSVLLTLLIVADVTGVIAIPGFGYVYEIAGREDPNVERAVERVQEKLSRPDLDPEKRKQLQAQLLGIKKRVPGATPVAAVTSGIEKEKIIENDARKLAVSVYSDQDKQPAALALPSPEELEVPNLPEGLTAEAIYKVISDNNRSMSLCLAEAMRKGESLKGRMDVELTIDAKGRVTEATIKDPDYARSSFGSCTVRRVLNWRFPRFDGDPVTVVFPYVLSAGM